MRRACVGDRSFNIRALLGSRPWALSHQRTNVEEDMGGEITSWRNSRARRYVTHSTHFLKRQSREWVRRWVPPPMQHWQWEEMGMWVPRQRAWNNFIWSLHRGRNNCPHAEYQCVTDQVLELRNPSFTCYSTISTCSYITSYITLHSTWKSVFLHSRKKH